MGIIICGSFFSPVPFDLSALNRGHGNSYIDLPADDVVAEINGIMSKKSIPPVKADGAKKAMECTWVPKAE